MPQLQVVDLSPRPRQQTKLEETISAFAERNRMNEIEKRETDALRSIYDEYRQDGRNIEDALMAIQTRPGISPTARVNAANQLMQFQKHNYDLQKQAKIDAEKAHKAARAQQVTRDIEQRRELPEGSLAAYQDSPALAASVTKPATPPKPTQASQPIDPDQLRRIQHVRSNPAFESASPSKKYQMLTDSGVSKENAKAEADIAAAEEKPRQERETVLARKQAENDAAFYDEQVSAIPRLFRTQETLDRAAVLNEEGATGKIWDDAMQAVGLLQYTTDGRREFASYAKEMVKNQNIRNIVGSQISQMEFGFFRDATISERFSKEANRQILKKEEAALRYERLYATIAKEIVDQNNGQIPVNLQQKVNDKFADQSQKITREVREAAKNFEAIQKVPKGFVLMYDPKRRPIHVPENKVQQAVKSGATLK